MAALRVSRDTYEAPLERGENFPSSPGVECGELRDGSKDRAGGAASLARSLRVCLEMPRCLNEGIDI